MSFSWLGNGFAVLCFLKAENVHQNGDTNKLVEYLMRVLIPHIRRPHMTSIFAKEDFSLNQGYHTFLGRVSSEGHGNP